MAVNRDPIDFTGRGVERGRHWIRAQAEREFDVPDLCHVAGLLIYCIEFLLVEGYSIEGSVAVHKHGLDEFVGVSAYDLQLVCRQVK